MDKKKVTRIVVDVHDEISAIVALGCARELVASKGKGMSLLTEEGVLWVIRKDNHFEVYKDKQ